MVPLENKSPDEVKRIVEALLFAVQEPISVRKISEIVEGTEAKEIREVIQQLREEYDTHDRVFQIEEIANGFQLLSRPEYHEWISKIRKKSGESKLSQQALETLSIIAYKQPIGRYEVEAIRGVDSSGVLKTLLNRNLIKIKGRDSGPGRPLLYQTTNKFLEHFGLNRLSDMPKLKEITELMEADPTLGEQIVVFEENEPDDTNIDSPGPEATAG